MKFIKLSRIRIAIPILTSLLTVQGCGGLYDKAFVPLYKDYIGNFSRYAEPLTNKIIENGKWKMVWSDEFDYTGMPDGAKWKYDEDGFGWWKSGLDHYARSEKENAYVKDGKLAIEARKAGLSGYSSCRLLTKEAWKYGRIDVKAKLPSGRGISSGIWLLPRDSFYGDWPSSGEIDMLENVGFYSNACHFSVHTRYYESRSSSYTEIAGASTGFHIYSLVRRADKIIALVDGNQIFQYDKTINSDFTQWPFDHEFYLVLNIAVGGNWGGIFGVDDSIFPQKMEIDYIRVYEEL